MIMTIKMIKAVDDAPMGDAGCQHVDGDTGSCNKKVLSLLYFDCSSEETGIIVIIIINIIILVVVVSDGPG